MRHVGTEIKLISQPKTFYRSWNPSPFSVYTFYCPTHPSMDSLPEPALYRIVLLTFSHVTLPPTSWLLHPKKLPPFTPPPPPHSPPSPTQPCEPHRCMIILRKTLLLSSSATDCILWMWMGLGKALHCSSTGLHDHIPGNVCAWFSVCPTSEDPDHGEMPISAPPVFVSPAAP